MWEGGEEWFASGTLNNAQSAKSAMSDISERTSAMSLNKRLTCYHEAGHAIRAYFLRKQSLVAALTTLQQGEGGNWNG